MLHELAGGNLLWILLERGSRGPRDTLWHAVNTLFGQYLIWRLLLSLTVYASSARELVTSLGKDDSDTAGSPPDERSTEGQQQKEQDEQDEAIPPPPAALPIPFPTTAAKTSSGRRRSYVSMILGGLPYVGMFIIGLVAIGLALCAILYHLIVLIWPCVGLYWSIAAETSAWGMRNATEPCPQLWKDGLEDELWWF